MKFLPVCLLATLLVCSILNAGAQEYNPYARNLGIGIKGGVSLTNLSAGSSGNPLSAGYSSVSGPSMALYSEIKLSDLVSIEPELEYSSEGGKKNGLQAFPVPADIAAFFTSSQYLYARFNSTVKLNYLMLPVLVKLGFDLGDSLFRIYVAGGPFVGLLLNAKQTSTGSSLIYTDKTGTQTLPLGSQSFNQTMDLKNQLQTINYGIEGNIGLMVNLDNIGRSFISVEVGGNYGLENIQVFASNGKNSTGAAVISLGYSCFF